MRMPTTLPRPRSTHLLDACMFWGGSPTGGVRRVIGAKRAHLRALGWRLRLLDTRPPAEPPRDGETVIEASILDDDALDAACAGADAVVHLAAFRAERPWADILSLNIDGTQRVLAAARAVGVDLLARVR